MRIEFKMSQGFFHSVQMRHLHIALNFSLFFYYTLIILKFVAAIIIVT